MLLEGQFTLTATTTDWWGNIGQSMSIMVIAMANRVARAMHSAPMKLATAMDVRAIPARHGRCT
jgi:hypothetical protein